MNFEKKKIAKKTFLGLLPQVRHMPADHIALHPPKL